MQLTLPLLLLFAVIPAAAFDQAQALSRLDQAANGFPWPDSQNQKIAHTAVIKESTEENGQICLRRLSRAT